MSDQESVIEGISFNGLDNIKIHADFLTNGSATPDSEGINGTFEKNINGDGKLSLNWRSSEGGGLSAGQVVTVGYNGIEYKYFLEENYTPSPNGDGTYTWSPTFVDTDSNLKGIIVYKQINVYRNDVVNIHNPTLKSVKIYTFPMTGTASMIVALLNTIADEAGVGEVQLGDDYKENTQMGSVFVSVSFDQDSLVSAAEKLASALGTNSTIENGHICIGTHDGQLAVSEHFDRFVILGGTRNMGKRVMEGDDTYAAVTLRLTLPDEYEDSVYPQEHLSPAGHMTKVLIFDDIYPKIKLKVKGVRERICYLYDDEGKIFIKDGQAQTYSKFYVTLDYYHEAGEGSGEESGYKKFAFDVKTVIEGRTLGIVFQSGLLTGREFDLAYYDDDYNEYDSHEDKEWIDWPDGEEQHHSGSWEAEGGEFRICIVADGDTLLPNTTLRPQVGDFVTLTGVVIDDEYERIAQQDLLKAALPYVELYMSTKEKEAEVSVNSSENEYVVDFLTGETVEVSPGDNVDSSGNKLPEGMTGDYIVTSVTTDIKTGRQSVRYGTFEPQSKMSSMANKLETASVSAGAAFVGQGNDDDYIRHTAAMSLDQFKTLYEVYGHLGKRIFKEKFDVLEPQVAQLVNDVEAIGQQADRKIDLWFRKAEPLPNIYKPNDTANLPASNWTEEEKPGHDQDLYYDNRRLVLGSTDCRVWRWEEVELTTNGTTTKKWLWNEVTDAQTIAALELIADVASDGILSAGAEKSRVLVEWRAAAADHADLATRVKSFNASAWQAYDAAYQALCDMLNNGATYSSGTPLWLDEDHILTNTTIDDPDDYRDVWNEYYEALAALTGEITAKKCSVFVSDSDNPPTPPYNPGDMWIQPDQDNKVLYCVTGKTSSEQYNATDWQDMSAQPDARSLLIALAEEVYASGYFENATSGDDIVVDFGQGTIDGSQPQNPSAALTAALAGCHDAFGNATITITFGSVPNSSNETFDLALMPLVFNDPLIGDSVNGGIDIYMYNAKGTWELVSKSTASVIDNLGNAIRNLVFGWNNEPGTVTAERQRLMQAAGLTIKQNFAQIFAQVTGEQGNVLSDAFVNVYTQGVLSGIKLKANAVQIDADNISLSDIIKVGTKSGGQKYAYIDATDINFSGKTVNISGATSINLSTAGELNLNAATVLFNAEKINWFPEQSATTESDGHKYRDIITNTTQGVTEKKFRVDDEGNVTMNNATVLGTIYANAGYIGGANGWTIATNQISKGNIGGSDSMFLSTENLAGTIGGVQINQSQTTGQDAKGWRLTVSSKFGVLSDGTLVASNALLSGNFKTAGGKIEISETDRGSYNWYGLAYVGSYGTDSVAIGMRDYGNNTYGGHISLLGNGGNGGIFDVLTGGQTTQSSLIMGSSLQHIGVSIDGVGKSIKIGDSDYRYSTPSETNYLSFLAANDGSTPRGYMMATGGLNIGGNTNVNGLSVSHGNVCLPCVIKTSSFTLPVDPPDGMIYICKGNGSDLVVTTSNKPITYGNHSDNEVGTNSSKNYGKDSFILVYSATMSKWVLLWCGG